MEKSKFEKFIGKYSLSGACDSVLFVVNNGITTVKATPSDGNVLVEVTGPSFDLPDGEYAVYDTKRLLSLLGVLGENLTPTVKQSNGTNIGLVFTDTRTEVTFALADSSVIVTPPKPSKIPPFDLSIQLDGQFISSFVKARGVMKDDEAETFAVSSTGVDTTAQVILGKSNVNTNRIKLTVNTTSIAKLDSISFSAKYLRELLVANKEVSTAELHISSLGLAKTTFKSDDITSTYYLIS